MSEDKILPGTELKFVGEIHGIKVLADPSVSDDEIKIAQDLILYDKSHKDDLIKDLVEAIEISTAILKSFAKDLQPDMPTAKQIRQNEMLLNRTKATGEDSG